MSQQLKIADFWENVQNQRILIHAYMLTRLGLDPNLIYERVFVGGRDRLDGRLDILKDEPSVMDEEGHIIDDPSLGDNNPYKLIGDQIQEEVGDLDSQRIRLINDHEGMTFARFYETAFQVSSGRVYRNLVLENLLWLLDIKKSAIEPLPLVRDFPHEEYYLLSTPHWKIALTISSSLEIGVGNILFCHRIARERQAIPVVVALAFSNEAQKEAIARGEGTKDVYLINLLAYLKLTHEVTKFREAGKLSIVQQRFSELFTGKGGLVVISEWAKKLEGT